MHKKFFKLSWSIFHIISLIVLYLCLIAGGIEGMNENYSHATYLLVMSAIGNWYLAELNKFVLSIVN